MDKRVLNQRDRKPPNGFHDLHWGFLHLNPQPSLRKKTFTSYPTSVCPRQRGHMIISDVVVDADGESATTAGTEHIMTDGIGYANGAFFKQIKEIMGREFLPQAVQGRYRGAKVSSILSYPSTSRLMLFTGRLDPETRARK